MNESMNLWWSVWCNNYPTSPYHWCQSRDTL